MTLVQKAYFYCYDSCFIDNANDNRFENVNIVKYDLFYAIIVASEFGGVFRGVFGYLKRTCGAIIAQFGRIINNVFN